MSPRALLAVGLLGIAGLIGFLFVDQRESREHSATLGPAPSSDQPSSLDAPVLASPARVMSEQSNSESVESYLKSFWGAEWSTLKDQYSTLDLTMDMARAGLLPWEKAREEIDSKARAYYERDLEFFRTMFLGRAEENADKFLAQMGVTAENKEEVMAGLRVELGDLDAQLESLSTVYVAELDAAMAGTFSRDPEKYPLVDLRKPSEASGSKHSIDVEGGGWYVTYHCIFSEHPRLLAIQEERDKLFGVRMARMTEYLKKSTGRR